jgi:hypothetical protein
MWVIFDKKNYLDEKIFITEPHFQYLKFIK